MGVSSMMLTLVICGRVYWLAFCAGESIFLFFTFLVAVELFGNVVTGGLLAI